ncbi:MAG: hypothetical protein M1389_09365 [Chloroflexi bacterium]|nr:hypothetical protein [Chloroflexota bacterium]
MERMIRKQVYLEPAQEARLKRVAELTGQSEAELIRRALDQQIATLSVRRNQHAWEAEKAYIQKRIRRGRLPGGRTWTRDELHDR